ncbi:MAG: 3-methylornithyl-N6-L-lysine dehydrogenase PylD [Candidatus Methanomethylophilaceae archaeon]|nr:3-methylornithyl-N6-L-lysine dehydrogenase PylD [Candidatus Methanomethylophilaceae archaeon]
MTRLTSDMIAGVPEDRIDLDSELKRMCGTTVKEMAMQAAGLEGDCDFSSFKVGVVPITSGLGVIGGFAQSVDAIVKRLGMRSYVTRGTDVQGFSECIRDGADMVMMADDTMFIAYNVREGRQTNNSWGTAMGYSVCLRNAAGGLEGKEVLVIGAGFVGTEAVQILKGMGAEVSVTDIVFEKAKRLEERFGVKALQDKEEAISSHDLILNAAPASFPGRIMREGCIVSTPGVPHEFDEEGRRRAKAIIHDPLEIGTAVMAVNSASYSIKKRRGPSGPFSERVAPDDPGRDAGVIQVYPELLLEIHVGVQGRIEQHRAADAFRLTEASDVLGQHHHVALSDVGVGRYREVLSHPDEVGVGGVLGPHAVGNVEPDHLPVDVLHDHDMAVRRLEGYGAEHYQTLMAPLARFQRPVLHRHPERGVHDAVLEAAYLVERLVVGYERLHCPFGGQHLPDKSVVIHHCDAIALANRYALRWIDVQKRLTNAVKCRVMISESLVWVIIGGVLEPVWVIMLKKYDTAESRRWFWLLMTAVFMYLSPMCVGMAMKDMDLGTAYSMWTGMGAVFTMIVGSLLYHEKVDRIKVALVFMILVGVVGLHLSAGVQI